MPADDRVGRFHPLAHYRAKHAGSSLAHLFFHDLNALSAQLALLMLYRLRAHDIENIPSRGPLLIVANHQSFLDPVIIGAPLHARRHLDYVARLGLFNNPFFGGYISALNAISIRQNEPDAYAIREILHRIALGRAVLVFAEGTRTPNGLVEPFKRGIAVLLRRARCPIVPVSIEGAFHTWPRSHKLPKLFGCRIHVKFAEPLDPKTLLKDGPDAALIELHRQIEAGRAGLRQQILQQTNSRFPEINASESPHETTIRPSPTKP